MRIQLTAALLVVTMSHAAQASNANCDVDDPLLVDLSGQGVTFSDVAHGVTFDINATRAPRKVAWPTRGSFLAVDLNGDGQINDGSELFGNRSPKQTSFPADGFGALAYYDSNGDDVIDENDLQFSSLLLWTDKNRDGKTQAGELISLEDAGITTIWLETSTGKQHVDPSGNIFLMSAPALLFSPGRSVTVVAIEEVLPSSRLPGQTTNLTCQGGGGSGGGGGGGGTATTFSCQSACYLATNTGNPGDCAVPAGRLLAVVNDTRLVLQGNIFADTSRSTAKANAMTSCWNIPYDSNLCARTDVNGNRVPAGSPGTESTPCQPY